MTFLEYILKASFCLSLFTVIYYFIIRGTTFHSSNRIVLLGFLLFSLAIPVFPVIEYSLPESPESQVFMEITRSLEELPAIELQTHSIQHSELGWWDVLKWVYTIGVIVFTFRFLVNLFKILNATTKYEKLKKGNLIIFKVPQHTAFSFFNWIFISKDQKNYVEEVLMHEEEHFRRWHSLDRVLVEIAIILFWFNPFIYLYRTMLIENHEYEIDRALVRKVNVEAYAKNMLSYVRSDFSNVMVSSFYSITKKRIIMMFKNKSSRFSYSRYLVIIPIFVGLIFLFSFRNIPIVEKIIPVSKVIQETEKDNIPSLFPLKVDEASYKVSSGFGKRLDPFTKEEKHHSGIDLKAKEGTIVVASADGVVEKVGFQPNGYGNFVTVRHGETYTTRYAQMLESSVKEGDKVSRGQQLGKVGSSGRSTAPHLHYEIKKNGKAINPEEFMKERLK